MDKQISHDENLPQSVKRFSIFILIVMGFVTAASILMFPKLQTKYSLKQFLPRQSMILNEEEKTRRVFQLPDSQPFVLALKMKASSSSWFQTANIETLKSLTEKMTQLEGVKSSLSIATIKGAISSKEGLNVGPLLESLPVNKWEHSVLTNPLLSPTFISPDGRTASIIINIKELNNLQLTELRNEVQEIAEQEMPFVNVELGGTPAVQTDVGALLQREVRNFVMLGFLVCLLVLALVFSNRTPIVISFIITIAVNFIILGTMAALGYSFTVLSTTIPIIATVTVVSLCIHTMLRIIEERKNNPDEKYYLTVLRTLKLLVWTNFMASFIPSIGFLSLLTTDVPLIRDYGVTVAMAMVISWIVASALLYPLLLLMKPPQARAWGMMKARWGLYFFRRSGVWALVIIVLASALAVKGQSLSWSAKLFDDLPHNHQVRLSTETIDRELGGMIPVDVLIQGSVESWNDPKLVSRLDSLQDSLRHIEGIGSVIGLPDLVAATQIHNTRLPASRASMAEIFFLYSLSSESPLKNFLSSDSSSTRISIRTRDLPGNELQDLVSNIVSSTKKAFPGMAVQVGGMGSTIHHLNNQLSKELIFGFWQAMAVILILLIFLFRSVRWALVACVPNLVPPAVLLGFLALTQTPIKPSVAIIFSIALGMAFNNTVYLLQRLKTLKRKPVTNELDIEKALWLEGNPCLIASLTILSGFSVFMASYFAMNRIFGFYMLLSMLAGLVGDLILLPTLLKSWPWLLSPIAWKKEKSTMDVVGFIFAIVVGSSILIAPERTQAQPPSATKSTSSMTAEQLGKELGEKLRTQDESFNVKMKIIEADGSTKDREMKVWRLSPAKKEHYLLVRMSKPQDLKGTALLATLKEGKEDKWIYLPSSKQTRRLSGDSGGGSQGGILGSELSTEDFDFNADRGAQSNVSKEIEAGGKKYYVVESNVEAASDSYSKVVSFVAQDTHLPVKSECYDKSGKLLKTIDLLGYKKLPGDKYRVSKIVIKNVQNKRGTEILLSQIKINQGLKTSQFTPKALSEED
jgi:predicted RND superfamily exporter protein